MKKSLYVDNCVTAWDNEIEAVMFYNESKCALKETGMNLRKWKTNNETLKSYLIKNEAQVSTENEYKVFGK